MSAIQYLGNGNGRLYVVEPDGTTVNRSFVNNQQGVRDFKAFGPVAASIQARSAEGKITVDTIDASGGTFQILINASSVGGTTNYAGGTTTSELAEDIADVINASSDTYVAAHAGDDVYIRTVNPGVEANGYAISIVDGSSTTYTIENMAGGSGSDQVYDPQDGFRFFINANFDSSGCAGCGSNAPAFDLTNAVEITDYIVTQSLQNNPYTDTITISSGVVNPSRKASDMTFRVAGEGAAADDLDTINISGSSDGDKIHLVAASSGAAITVKHNNGNIKLATGADLVLTNPQDRLTLQWDSEENEWMELSRGGSSTIAAGAVDTTELAAGAVTTAKIDALAVTSAELAADAVTTVKIADDNVTTAKIADNNVTVAKVEDSLTYEAFVVPVSFETGEQCDNKWKAPFDCTVTDIYAIVTKAIAGTDSGTITPKNNAGTTMTGGVITFTASSALNTAQTSTPSANNTLSDGDVMSLTTAKTTAGGKALVTIHVTRT